MAIGRKLLLPTIGLFAVLLISLVIYFSLNASSSLQAEENRRLLNLAQVFEQDGQARSEVALALAKQVAGNPEVVQAFSDGDRLRLINLTLNAYNAVEPLYDLTQQQYVQAPTGSDALPKALLRLQDINRYGDDLSASRVTLVTALTLKNDVSGLELAEDGLSLRGVALLDTGSGGGAVDIGMALNQKSLDNLKLKYGSEWQIFLDDQARQDAGYVGSNGPVNPVESRLRLLTSTLADPVYSSAEAYQKAMAGETVILRNQVGDKSYSILSLPLRDYSGRVVGVVDVIADRTQLIAAQRSRITFAILAGLAGLVLGGLLLSMIVQRTLAPVRQLTGVAQAFAAGDLQARLPAGLEQRLKRRRLDEIDLLAQGFSSMAAQLRRLVGNLEERVSERTANLERRSAQLRAVADIARDVTVVTDVQALLEQAVQLIRQRFDFYHAAVFLIDERGEYAVLRAASGDAGRRMIETSHRLRVGQVGIVGSAAGSGQAHLSQDVTQDPSYYKNPLLPDTRSEMALPLRLGSKIIGVLDVQSTRPNAFDEGDITVSQLLADQLAIALNNARLIQELNRSMQELEQAYSSITQQTWGTYTRQKSQVLGYSYVTTPGSGMQTGPGRPGNEQISVESTQNLHAISAGDLRSEGLLAQPAAREALEMNKIALSQPDGSAQGSGTDNGTVLAVPIRLRGQGIGVIQLRFETGAVPPELVDLVDDVGARLGLVLESARLLHEAQRLAAREQQINRIAGEMRSSVDLDAILQNTVRELGKALGARRTYIQLGDFSATGDSNEHAASVPSERGNGSGKDDNGAYTEPAERS